jgi:uncharacterized protein (TIGR01319 family)
MAVDIGGATTDVYTMCDGAPSMPNVVLKGLPEPFAKRSVECDLGLRYNIDSLAESAVVEHIARDLQLPASAVQDWVTLCKKSPGTISAPGSPPRRIDEYLTAHAVKVAVERHCGTLESVYTPLGETFLMTGKDLTAVPAVVGIGGPVINADNPAAILKAALRDTSPGGKGALDFLKPTAPQFFLDKKYIFSAMGLVSKIDPRLALDIMKAEIVEVTH